jgi:hypothetical protein
MGCGIGSSHDISNAASGQSAAGPVIALWIAEIFHTLSFIMNSTVEFEIGFQFGTLITGP